MKNQFVFCSKQCAYYRVLDNFKLMFLISAITSATNDLSLTEVISMKQLFMREFESVFVLTKDANKISCKYCAQKSELNLERIYI